MSFYHPRFYTNEPTLSTKLSLVRPKNPITNIKIMTLKPIILISSLLVSAGATVTTFTDPAQAFITQFTTSVPQDVIGYTRTFTDTQGRDLTGISLSSSSFPFTSFTGNGTSSLTANFFGGAVPANTPFTIFTNIADPPGSFSVTNTNTAYVLNNGAMISQNPTFGAGFICSTQGGGTPYQAVQLSSVGGNPAGFVECQGDTVGRINETTTPFTESISVKPISGYQPISDLGTFPPAITVTENPGVNPSVARASAAVPEPSGILGTLAFGIMVAVYRLKRQSKKATF